jgi:hypothetical protein
MELSDLDSSPSGPAVCRPRLGAISQLSCTSTRSLIIGSTGGGGGRRRQIPLDPGGRRPYSSTTDLSYGEDLHRSMGSTPRTARAKDYHAAHLTNTFPHCTSVVGASINRSRLIRLRCTTGSVEFVRQPGTPVIRPLHHPNRQRLCSWVMGLNGRAKPLSGAGGRRGATPKEVTKVKQVEEQEEE